ncbi:hypothetical protein, partial [Archangium violaceum]|uniref:hypothetical protein n=1 Tax=Archangium violaceum TaxID=83451 RepID=UPI0005BE5EA7
MKQLLVVALAALSLVACSSPEAGDACSPDGSGVCASNTEALFCESSVLRAIPCSGTTGCIANNDRVACDFSRATAGQACPRSVEGQGQCAVGQPDNLLKCTSGTWTAQACKGCA